MSTHTMGSNSNDFYQKSRVLLVIFRSLALTVNLVPFKIELYLKCHFDF